MTTTITTAIQTANELLRRHGITVSMTRDTDSSAMVSREPLPAEDARRLVAALTALGIEASSAPDHDDRSREWLYLTIA